MVVDSFGRVTDQRSYIFGIYTRFQSHSDKTMSGIIAETLSLSSFLFNAP
jgi:hypothetical protein